MLAHASTQVYKFIPYATFTQLPTASLNFLCPSSNPLINLHFLKFIEFATKIGALLFLYFSELVQFLSGFYLNIL